MLIALVAEVGSSKHVLVVEDDDSIRDLLEQALSDAEYGVWTAINGAEALRVMHEHSPDLLLLDLMMPDMNGWELLRCMSESADLRSVPVLVVSAASPNGLRDAQELGAPVFLPKPFDVDELLFEIERLISAPTRQCAWCRQVASSSGEFNLHSGQTLAWATHGVCPVCKRQQIQRILGETP